MLKELLPAAHRSTHTKRELLTTVWSDGTRENGFKMKEGRFRLGMRRKFVLEG